MPDLEQLKHRLQFTGWLQYLPTALLALVFLVVALVISWLGSGLVALAFGSVAALLFAILIFDLITVKLRLHPKEPLPGAKSDMDAFDLMRSRQSCRSFQNCRLTAADHSEIMKIVGANSEIADANMFGKEPLRFEYIAARLTVWPVVGASEFLVAIAPQKYNRLAIIDVGHSLQKIVIEATRRGVATCWIGPGADQSSIVSQLGNRFDPDNDHIICVCAIGYKSRYKPLFLRLIQRLQKKRLPLESLFYADTDFRRSLVVDATPCDRFGRCYEVCQWSPSAFNGQTTRCVCVTKQKENAAIVRFDFYATTNSRFYAAVALGIWCANWELGCQALGICGRFAVLTAEERMVHGDETKQNLPRYDISWVLDE